MKKKSVRRPISQIPTPESQSTDSQPTDLSSLLRSLSAQTHLELTDDLQDPLVNKLKIPISRDEFWESLFEAVREAHRKKPWKR